MLHIFMPEIRGLLNSVLANNQFGMGNNPLMWIMVLMPVSLIIVLNCR